MSDVFRNAPETYNLLLSLKGGKGVVILAGVGAVEEKDTLVRFLPKEGASLRTTRIFPDSKDDGTTVTREVEEEVSAFDLYPRHIQTRYRLGGNYA